MGGNDLRTRAGPKGVVHGSSTSRQDGGGKDVRGDDVRAGDRHLREGRIAVADAARRGGWKAPHVLAPLCR